ncbi:MAG TPA: phytanoyl-CoA dioxygenase family protein, partial [Verrucomicrobiales bacterium]|nr:phytanoyl-CoA dioxygenase family protein [Verrucomicrobiales bacterium]
MNLMTEGSDKFEITPAISKQERSNKRFEFTPASCEAPQVLNAAQIQGFNQDGFITGLRLFSPETIAEIRHYFDRLLMEALQSGGSS